MGGGGKGGSQTTVQEIPKWLEEPTVRNLARAEQAANIGYTPYYGPEVAAFNPTQMAAMQSNIGAAEAFGLVPQGQLTAAQGMPAPTTYAGGMQGYGSSDLYEQAVSELRARRPGQVAAMERMYVDPMTGLMPGETEGDQAGSQPGSFSSGYDWMPIINPNGFGTTDPLASYFDPEQGGYSATQANLGKAASRAGVDPNDYMIVGNQVLRRTARG